MHCLRLWVKFFFEFHASYLIEPYRNLILSDFHRIYWNIYLCYQWTLMWDGRNVNCWCTFTIWSPCISCHLLVSINQVRIMFCIASNISLCVMSKLLWLFCVVYCLQLIMMSEIQCLLLLALESLCGNYITFCEFICAYLDGLVKMKYQIWMDKLVSSRIFPVMFSNFFQLGQLITKGYFETWTLDDFIIFKSTNIDILSQFQGFITNTFMKLLYVSKTKLILNSFETRCNI